MWLRLCRICSEPRLQDFWVAFLAMIILFGINFTIHAMRRKPHRSARPPLPCSRTKFCHTLGWAKLATRRRHRNKFGGWCRSSWMED